MDKKAAAVFAWRRFINTLYKMWLISDDEDNKIRYLGNWAADRFGKHR